MNENFGAQPTAFESSFELKYLIDNFGPSTGRYLANFPHDWLKQVRAHIDDWPDVEKSRAEVLIRRAFEKCSIVDYPGLSWDPEQDWMSNLIPKLTCNPAPLNGGIVNSRNDNPPIPNLYTLDTLELPPTTDERINATPEEIARVSRTLILISHELYLVDPFFNPCRNDYFDVLVEILKISNKGRCKKITIICRAKSILESFEISEIKQKIRMICVKAQLNAGKTLEMILLDDSKSLQKMHARYLLSIKGGVQYDQGFQKLSKGRMVDVTPIGPIRLDELIKIYHEGKSDMSLVEKIIYPI